MLKVENIDIYGWEAAIRGMRNPMNSWEKSDSEFVSTPFETSDEFNSSLRTVTGKITTARYDWDATEKTYFIGDADLDLMKRLAKAGSVHAKYRRMINVAMDITAPLYWWKEFDTYKVGTVANSCSTMHKIQEKEFTLEDFSCEHLYRGYFSFSDDVKETEIEDEYESRLYYPLDILETWIIPSLNKNRDMYVKTKDKIYWWQMIQLLPSSYNQRRTVQLNYEVLSHLYFDRKSHKLDEWHTLCDVIRELPYAKDIITMEE